MMMLDDDNADDDNKQVQELLLALWYKIGVLVGSAKAGSSISGLVLVYWYLR